MGRIAVFLSLIILGAASTALPADDVVTQAMKLYEKRHYDESISLLRSEAASIEHVRQGTAFLTLGMAYFKNAILHSDLSRASAAVSQDYLKKLAAAQRSDRSLFVDLYLGEALVETGKPGVAAIYFEKFSGSERVEPRYRTIGKIGLGLCYHLNNEPARAVSLWTTIDSSDSEIKSELAAAYSKAGLAEKNPAKMADESLAEARKSGKPLPMRLVRNSSRSMQGPVLSRRDWICSSVPT